MTEAIPIDADARAAMRRLAAKGEAAARRAEELGDWGGDLRLPKWLPHRFAAAVISQLHFGERATGRLCRHLVGEIDDQDARRCLAVQAADEDRHARFYEAYLARLGDQAPVDPAMAAVIERALAWDGPPEGAVAAFNVVIEGEALRTLDDMAGWLTCPLFRRVNARVTGDEARHLAFGRIYLRATLKTLDRGQRLDIYRWLKGLWAEGCLGVLDGFRVPGLVTRRRRRRWTEAGWVAHLRALMAVGLIDADEIRLAEGHRPAGRAP